MSTISIEHASIECEYVFNRSLGRTKWPYYDICISIGIWPHKSLRASRCLCLTLFILCEHLELLGWKQSWYPGRNFTCSQILFANKTLFSIKFLWLLVMLAHVQFTRIPLPFLHSVEHLQTNKKVKQERCRHRHAYHPTATWTVLFPRMHSLPQPLPLHKIVYSFLNVDMTNVRKYLQYIKTLQEFFIVSKIKDFW